MSSANYGGLNANASHENLHQDQSRYDGFAGYEAPRRKKGTSNWIKCGLPLLLIIIIAAVVGGVVGSHKKKNSSSSPSSSAAQSASAAASAAASAKSALGQFAVATDSFYMMPIYPSTTDSAAFSAPTFISNDAQDSWPSDPFQPANPDVLTVRSDHPVLIAPAYKWAALPGLIATDPYLKHWNDTIFGNASFYASVPPVVYFMDNSSGILDNARDFKRRVKTFSYVYRMTNDTKWVDLAWREIANVAGNGTTTFGPATDRWNSGHFLDVAEFSAGYAIGYDWLYDILTADQKSQMISTLMLYGLNPGINQITTGAGWWAVNTTGNWNCVCNNGLTMASLAILNDEPTGVAKQILQFTVNNAKNNCVQAVSTDGTWAETANYWYFGTTGLAEMAASLLSATGSDYGLMSANPNLVNTGDFHMYVTGATSLFNYGDHGPNKYSTTANAMMFIGNYFNQPQYQLFQRDMYDAAEPWSMFWYQPNIAGAFWDTKPLDHFFGNFSDQWASMRSTWTDVNGLYVAMKAGTNLYHQNHNDLDCGDFVMDALGTRWAGELGSADYNSPGYFTSVDQAGQRWQYYRKMTEGQNTILINKSNQNLNAAPTVNFGTTNETQGPTTVNVVDKDSTAFFTQDMTSAYFDATSVKRGIRLLNGRRQVLLQDEVTASQDVMWRMHTNATVTVDSSGTSATLTLDGQTMIVQMLNPPSGAKFTTSDAVRFPTDVTPPIPDQPNPGVTVLIIDLPAGTYTLQVLFNPQWPSSDSVNYVTPPAVALDSWTLRSHDSS